MSFTRSLPMRVTRAGKSSKYGWLNCRCAARSAVGGRRDIHQQIDRAGLRRFQQGRPVRIHAIGDADAEHVGQPGQVVRSHALHAALDHALERREALLVAAHHDHRVFGKPALLFRRQHHAFGRGATYGAQHHREQPPAQPSHAKTFL